MEAQPVKQEPLATLTMTYHPSMLKVKPRLNAMGVRLSFTLNSTIGQQLYRSTQSGNLPRGSVYIMNCLSVTCSEVYIGQTGKVIEARMLEHTHNTLKFGAVQRHNALPGHQMDTNNPTQVYRSDCKYTRETVEAALIYSATTIQNNTASVSVVNNDLVVSFICHATKLHWHNLLSCVPHFKEE